MCSHLAHLKTGDTPFAADPIRSLTLPRGAAGIMKKPSSTQRCASRESFPFLAHGLFVSIYAFIAASMIALNLTFVPFWLFAAAFALFGRCSIVVDDTVIANASSDTHGKKFAGAN